MLLLKPSDTYQPGQVQPEEDDDEPPARDSQSLNPVCNGCQDRGQRKPWREKTTEKPATNKMLAIIISRLLDFASQVVVPAR